jgi:Sec7-like guanine-nucleotide exchange factor
VSNIAQAMGLLAEPLDAREVACFLRRCPGLSKTTIGELLGEPSEFWLSVLTHFVDTFDFAGQPLA